MERKAKKKSKVKVDKSAKSAIFQLVYDFLKRDDSACEIAELLKKKRKLVVNFSSLSTGRRCRARGLVICELRTGELVICELIVRTTDANLGYNANQKVRNGLKIG